MLVLCEKMMEVQRQNSFAQSKICGFKVVLLGKMSVGKTSLAVRFAKGRFNPTEENTIGAAYLTQTVLLDDTTIRLEIWDTAGQERYEWLVALYYRGAQAAIVVYDITDEVTFEGAKKWVKVLRREIDPQTLIVLVGNKQDLANKRMVECEEAQAYADENKLIFMEASAKTAINVNEIFLTIAKKLSTKKEKPGEPDKGRRLTGSDTGVKTSSNCCK